MDRGPEVGSPALQEIEELLRRAHTRLELAIATETMSDMRKGALHALAGSIEANADWITTVNVTPNWEKRIDLDRLP